MFTINPINLSDYDEKVISTPTKQVTSNENESLHDSFCVISRRIGSDCCEVWLINLLIS